MELNENIFRAYDIRGIAFEDLSENVVTKIGVAIARLAKNNNRSEIIVGRDGRNSSPKISSFLKHTVV